MNSDRGGLNAFSDILLQLQLRADGCKLAHGVVIWRAVQADKELCIGGFLCKETVRLVGAPEDI